MDDDAALAEVAQHLGDRLEAVTDEHDHVDLEVPHRGSIASASTATPSGERSSVASPGSGRASQRRHRGLGGARVDERVGHIVERRDDGGIRLEPTGASTRASAERTRRSSTIVAIAPTHVAGFDRAAQRAAELAEHRRGAAPGIEELKRHGGPARSSA